MHKTLLRLILICLAFVLFACTTLEEPEAGQLIYRDIVGALEPGHTFGQVFLFEQPGLNNVTLWLASPSEDENQENLNLDFELYLYVGDIAPLVQSTYTVQLTRTPAPIKIQFQPIKNSSSSFFLKISNASRMVKIYGSNLDVYPFGTAVSDNRHLTSDAAFKLSYRYDLYMAAGDVKNFFNNVNLVIPLSVILFFPGWIVLTLSSLKKKLDLGERLGLIIAISLACFPLLLLWSSQLGYKWHLNPASGKFLFWICLLVVLSYYAVKILKQVRRSSLEQAVMVNVRRINLIDVSLIFILIIAFYTRFVMVRDLTFPPWVDSIHHALFTRLIVDSGQLPGTYEPILSIQPTDYHLGFHSITAFFIWISGLEIPNGILTLGQVLNSLIIFSVYLLTKSLTHDRTAGLAATVLATLFSPMPAYYTSWGRYPQLAGLLLLPAGFFLFQQALKSNGKRRLITWVITSFVWGGIFLIHYRVASFLGCLVLASLLVESIILKRISPKAAILSLLLIVGLTSLWIFPWLLPTIQNTFLKRLVITNVNKPDFFNGFNLQYLTSHDGIYCLILAAMGMVVGTIKRKPVVLIMTLWVCMLFLLANLSALGLPGGSLVNNNSVAITLFLPIAVMGGVCISEFGSFLQLPFFLKFYRWIKITVWFFGIVIVLVGANRILTILNPGTILAYPSDLKAIAWIKDNIPIEGKFLVSPFNWGYGIYAGSDGGYWISALTGNETIPPPVLYGLEHENKRKLINDVCDTVLHRPNDPQAIRELLIDQKIEYIYIGSKQAVLSADTFLYNDLYSLVYQGQGVWIFQIMNFQKKQGFP